MTPASSSTPLPAIIIDRMANRIVLALTAILLFAPADGVSWAAFALGMVLIAIPASMAERVLATTAGQPLLSGMQMLTRESDAARGWRVIGWSSLLASWLAAVLVAVLAGQLAGQVVATLADQREGIWTLSLQAPLFTLLLLAMAGLRSQYHVPVLLWLVPLTLLLFALMVQRAAGVELPLLDKPLSAPVLPASQAMLWGALGLFGGVGAIWAQAPAKKQVAPRSFWMAAILIGSFSFVGLELGAAGLFTALLGSMVAMLGLTALLEPGLAVLRQRGVSARMALVIVGLPLAGAAVLLCALGAPELLARLGLLLAVWMAANMILQAVFAGWLMKVSHGRKALELPSELSYNIWRVAARWLMPVLTVVVLADLARS